jgi:hypothetical protein
MHKIDFIVYTAFSPMNFAGFGNRERMRRSFVRASDSRDKQFNEQ